MFIEGTSIYLREVRESDVKLETYYQWMNDSENTRYLESRFFPQSMESIRKYVKDAEQNPNIVFLAVILPGPCPDLDKHIGNIKLSIDWKNRFAEVGIIIGKTHWSQGHGTEALKLIVEYAFGKLNLHKLWAGILRPNIGSLNMFHKAGFVDEGVLKSQYFTDGGYTDDIMVGIINEKEQKV